jgi:plastocyanin
VLRVLHTFKNINIMKTKFFFLASIMLTGIMLIYGCSKSYNSPMPPVVATGSASVSIQNMAFMPDTARIKTGGSVTWTNMDGITHTVTSLTSLFDSGNLAAGKAFKFTFVTAGTFNYHCTIHPTMKGVVVVTN